MKAIVKPTSIRWTRLWSRLVNRVRLRGRRRHLNKVARSRTLREKISAIAAQEKWRRFWGPCVVSARNAFTLNTKPSGVRSAHNCELPTLGIA